MCGWAHPREWPQRRNGSTAQWGAKNGATDHAPASTHESGPGMAETALLVSIRARTDAESLALTLDRVLPYFDEHIAPRLRSGEKVLIVAHGNSLRALVKHLDDISNEDILKLNIPTGMPLAYELDAELQVQASGYLAGEAAAREAAAAVANQGKATP